MKRTISRAEAEAIYTLYYVDLYKLACYLSKSKPIADDLVSETFLKAFEKYHQYDKSKPIKPWLIAILVNCTRKYWRYKKYTQIFNSMSPTTSEDIPILDAIVENERDLYLWNTIHSLKPIHAEVLLLHYYEELTLKDISKILNIPLGTCKSRLNYGLEQLRMQKCNLSEFI